MCASPTVADLKGFDVVVNATGASSYVPDVHGLKDRVVAFEEAIACPKITCEFHPDNAIKANRQDRKPRKLEGTKVDRLGRSLRGGGHRDLPRFHRQGGDHRHGPARSSRANIEVIHMYVTWKRFQPDRGGGAAFRKPYRVPCDRPPGLH